MSYVGTDFTRKGSRETVTDLLANMVLKVYSVFLSFNFVEGEQKTVFIYQENLKAKEIYTSQT